ncbi:diguanylate cyclase domain-containing protein [Neptuniibacter sp. PT34_22]|uniref:diguanylate cyclase domain-containing protein n=1 Tax=Neptuniibacter sp. PT34_22 TaxID=3398205 RepID=UPI0039F5DA80
MALSNSDQFNHLSVLDNFDAISAFDFVPDVIWIFDLDRHGFWWGNERALEFWGLPTVQDLIDKDLSADTEGARKRTEQTFYKAAAQGMTVDPWTAYPNGKPKTLLMRHKAVLLGPEKHRGIIAFISEQVDLGEQPEHLIFSEAIRYTSVAVTSFDMSGTPMFENPAAAELYGFVDAQNNDASVFVCRFHDVKEGLELLEQGRQHQDGQSEHLMVTSKGVRRHVVDLRTSRHPLTGDYLLLVSEYDVTELHNALEQAEKAKVRLDKLAHYDALTGLPSLRLCRDRMTQVIAQAQREGSSAAIMFVDLDGFKAVNDSFGHDAGDQVLIESGKRLVHQVRAVDTVGRIGGDEFIILMSGIKSAKDAEVVASKIIAVMNEPFSIADMNGKEQEACIGVSVGISLLEEGALNKNAEVLLREADHAMYKVKRSGKRGYRFAS